MQNKFEALIDKHMFSLGASKLSLSSITSEALWQQTGRYSADSELLRLKDRRESGFLLAPTHEEEITALFAALVYSYKQLPLRLYQTGRKYRDEKRPRQGLLRAKEFMMKDLYTFDSSHDDALKTYDQVRHAYKNLFDELKIPYLVADADSGNMGGKLSHEYHFASSKGEDNVWSCESCGYVANEEVVEKKAPGTQTSPTSSLVFTGISKDRETAIEIHIPRPDSMSPGESPSWDKIASYVNLHAVKNAGVDIDTSVEAATLTTLLPKAKSTVSIFDRSLQRADSEAQSAHDLTIIRPGDLCPRCDTGHLSVQKAIEVGHTFHLGTRYSEPLQALVTLPDQKERQVVHMGCHGIGVSRLIGAIASLLADESGLNWPRVVAPFEVVITLHSGISDDVGTQIYDALEGTDRVLDDRPIKDSRLKMVDAQWIGFPIQVVLGVAWKKKGEVEVRCRRLGVKKDVPLDTLHEEVTALLGQL